MDIDERIDQLQDEILKELIRFNPEAPHTVEERMKHVKFLEAIDKEWDRLEELKAQGWTEV